MAFLRGKCSLYDIYTFGCMNFLHFYFPQNDLNVFFCCFCLFSAEKMLPLQS